MRSEDRVRLGHMIAAAKDAMGFVDGRRRGDLIVGMRNRLVHAYFDINAQLVWESATVEIPTMLLQLEQLAAVS